eukprot:9076110-Lingulodinium_polyedra.AAC.1
MRQGEVRREMVSVDRAFSRWREAAFVPQVGARGTYRRDSRRLRNQFRFCPEFGRMFCGRGHPEHPAESGAG